ncbi:ATP-dependent nuclease [Megalodesulfovibrio gigas]|uniref:Putative exonuclease n=1 Tax=Megalodesulfovibrio gigas (strain ATCC 19364 / DSM 1382 / NCIMB 9332 / VKM B-1759) TaxID=1121448 RepID=T2G882_MEGG1|nr:AAA family ATPase [Megalodesulfovibrio gigas]AGW12394.1 putative exonuclease [Megalodesulfovibrio gigas DSM 1382 = ATCC 19364]
MKLEKIRICNFRCFGPKPKAIHFEDGVTAFVGGNGSGKTACFLALSRLFGVTQAQRTVQRRDFHIGKNCTELESDATLSIEAIFGFPELEEGNPDERADAVPEYFQQMVASAPGEPLKLRMQLRATWIDDGTYDGNVDTDVRWITTLSDEYKWEDCPRVQAFDRGAIQLIYVPATRDASSQVANLLKGRLWQAARWSEKFRKQSSWYAEKIQWLFEKEKPLRFIIHHLTERWRQLHEADTDTTPGLRLVDSKLEELVRKVEFIFMPDEEGRERKMADLSDGQRSLFHIALTAAALEAEKEACSQLADECAFEHDKLHRTQLTLLAIEEPENNLSPFFLSRIVAQSREIGSMPNAQVMLSSHSPAIMSRIEPEEVRYFRLNRHKRQAVVRKLSLPKDNQEASKYVRLAVKAYPELYFARFVVLGEGDSERLVIPKIAEAMGVPLDPSFVPIVPLGGRFVDHFWKLLSKLGIPYATLLDLDLGRQHGGAKTVQRIVAALQENGVDLSKNDHVLFGSADPDALGTLHDQELLDNGHDWIKALAEENVFFSHPLDLDFAMLSAFPEAYRVPNPGGGGPRMGEKAVANKIKMSLKENGNPDLYDDSYDEKFSWYPYLFLSRSKPETHIAALTRISPKELARNAPQELKRLIATIRQALSLPE